MTPPATPCDCPQQIPDADPPFNPRTVARLKEELGDEVETVIEVFLRLLPERIRAIEQAILSNDAKNLRIFAHTLKGSACQLGAQRLSCLALDLENMGHDANFSKAEERFAQLANEATIVEQVTRPVFGLLAP